MLPSTGHVHGIAKSDGEHARAKLTLIEVSMTTWLYSHFGSWGLTFLALCSLSYAASHTFHVLQRSFLVHCCKALGGISFVLVFIAAGWRAGLLALPIMVAVSSIGAIAARVLRDLFLRRTTNLSNVGGVGRPSSCLERIEKDLGMPLTADSAVAEALNQNSRLGRAEEELLSYCQNIPEIQPLLSEFSLARTDLKKLYSDLLRAGAGLWVCGHYVAASSLTVPETLRFCILRKRLKINDKMFVYHLMQYFESGVPLPQLESK